jgi:triacylglycerol lipase
MANRTYPIVLAHGIARFDVIARAVLDDEDRPDDSTHYFRRIRSTLAAKGFTAAHSSVPWASAVRERAAVLKTEVERILSNEGHDKVHIIAHSMGGLDARHMLFEHQDARMHEKVASVSTIGTPHRGTTFADWGIEHGAAVMQILAMLRIDAFDGFTDLTTQSCRAFNQAAKAFERGCGVTFQTIAGTQELPFIFEPLKPSWALIFAKEGANDGLVSLESARWNDRYFRKQINADHLNQIGWWDSNDQNRFTRGGPGETRQEMEQRIRALYVEIAEDLARKFPVP